MPAPSISPTTLGATTYTVIGSKALVADLDLLVPGTGPGPSIEVSYPTNRASVHVTLTRDGISLDLIPPVDNGAVGGPPPKFAKRHVTSSLTPQGDKSVLDCQISALAGGDAKESWRVVVTGLAAGDTCEFSQGDNDPGDPTITRLVCDPVAEFTVGGGVTNGPAGAEVTEGDEVALTALKGVGPATAVVAPGAAQPGVVYQWTATPAAGIPALPACGPGRVIRFAAPSAPSTTGVELRLDVWLDSSCDAGPGLLAAVATATLTVNPLGITLSAEAAISPGAWYDRYGHFHVDNANGILGFWSSNRKDPVHSDEQVFSSRLDLANAGAGFPAPGNPVTGNDWDGFSHAALAADGDLVLSYQPNTGDNEGSLVFKKAPWQALEGAPEHFIYKPNPVTRSLNAFVAASGDWVVFFFLVPIPGGGGYGQYHYRRFSLDASHSLKAVDDDPQILSGYISSVGSAALPVTDRAGAVWFTFEVTFTPGGGGGSAPGCCLVRLVPQTNEVERFTQPPDPAGYGFYRMPCLVCAAAGDVWVFTGNNSYSRYSDGTWGPRQTGAGENPAAVEDASGRLWVIYETGSDPRTLVYSWWSDASGTWQEAKELAPGVAAAEWPTLLAVGSDLWAFYERGGSGDPPIQNWYYRRITPVEDGPTHKPQGHKKSHRPKNACD
jgi:hypothetical protein